MSIYLSVGQWYTQAFSSTSEMLYFIGDTYLKNGRLEGVLVEVDPTHPRRRPRVKRVSVHPKLDANIWRQAGMVPGVIIEWAGPYRRPIDTRGTRADRHRTHSR